MDATKPTRRSDKSATDDVQSTTTRRTFLGATAALAALTGTTSTPTSTADDTVRYSYPNAEADLRSEEAGAPMLSSRHPTVNELAEYVGVRPGDLATLSMAGRFRGEDPEDDPDFATAVAEELRAIADDVDPDTVEAEARQ